MNIEQANNELTPIAGEIVKCSIRGKRFLCKVGEMEWSVGMNSMETQGEEIAEACSIMSYILERVNGKNVAANGEGI